MNWQPWKDVQKQDTISRAGNWDRALKHYMVSVGDGDNDSVKNIKQLYMDGHATKEDYVRALRAYQGYLEEVWSEQRNKAAKYDDRYKYLDS